MNYPKALIAGVVTTLLAASSASAHSVRPRSVVGQVEFQDAPARTVTVLTPHAKALTEFLVRSDTRYIRNGQFTSENELKPGTKAVVYYRSPFFGRPYATKIVWITER